MKEKKLVFSVTKKDFDIHWFSGTGAGGQHRNKHKNCCRMVHRDSGISATGQSHRSQKQNLQEAFISIIENPKFRVWARRKSGEILGETAEIEKKVEKEMVDQNLKIEYYDSKNQKWEGQ